jgi:beta-lactamase regulating signal transducer with metallopeptidase domain
VTQRPDTLLAVLLGVAATALAALAAAVVEAGENGLLGFGAVGVGLVTACHRLAAELVRLPPALVLAGVAVVASAGAFAGALARLWREQRMLGALPARTVEETPFFALADPAVPIDVVPAGTPAAFCTGLLRPRVVVTEGLLARLGEDERRAAVAHELEHARGRAPLKVSLARLAARGLFWLPVLRDLADRYVFLAEVEADRAAVRQTSTPALAGALLEVLAAPGLTTSVGLADFADARLRRLVDPASGPPPLFRRSSIVLSGLSVVAVGALLVWQPHLAANESSHLHAMSVKLLAHRVDARLLGLAETAAAVLALTVLVRRLSRCAR